MSKVAKECIVIYQVGEKEFTRIFYANITGDFDFMYQDIKEWRARSPKHKAIQLAVFEEESNSEVLRRWRKQQEHDYPLQSEVNKYGTKKND